MTGAFVRPTREEAREWADELTLLDPENPMDVEQVEALFDNPRAVIIARRLEGDVRFAHIHYQEANDEFQFVRLYPEGPDVIRLVPVLVEALEETARRWLHLLDRLIFAQFQPYAILGTPELEANLQTQHEKCLAWDAVFGGTVTVELVTVSGGNPAWQAGTTLLAARNKAREIARAIQ